MNKHIKRLVKLAEACDGEGIREELKRIVPDYEPWGGSDAIGGEERGRK